MKVIVSGGGTGGHIYPAIAIIEELKRQVDDLDLIYVGTENSMEADLIPKLGIPFRTIRVKGLPRKFSKKSMIAIKELFLGLKDSKKILNEFKPDVVLGTGGFVTGPLLYHAAKTNAFTVFHEQNSYPGLTNRILSRYVDKYFVTFPESAEYFKYDDRTVVSGNPVRNKFENMNPKAIDYDYFGLDPERKTVFSFGGSNGSRSINRAVKEILPEFDKKQYQWIHVTGKNNYDDFLESIEKYGNSDRLKIYPYMEAMERAYNVADIVVTSSGAISLAEISYVGAASILVPKAYTTENHQEYNARSYEKAGASRVILEKDLTGPKLAAQIEDIFSHETILEDMKKQSSSLAKKDAAKIIVDTILECRW